MARKPPVSYAAMELGPPEPPPDEPTLQAGEGESAQVPAPTAQAPQPRIESRTLKEVSAHIMTYIHPDAAKALKRYAVENNCKVHDICVEALENWFRAHGLREKVRAEPRKIAG
ncbi:MAG: hypothetical protein WB524_00175 [Acidobacteriaceae bacterium]